MHQSRYSKPIFGAFFLASAALTLCLSASTAYAQSATLEGEIFETKNGDKVQAAVSCDGGTISLENITGPAVGPVPGMFTETFRITFGRGVIQTASVFFVIYDANGTVVGKGEKFVINGDGTVTCVFDPATKTSVFSVKATLGYSNLGGKDEGEATVEIIGTSGGGSLKPFQFTEIFHSSRWNNTAGKVTGGGHHTPASGSGVTFGFNAQNTDNGMKGTGLVIDRNVGVRIKILTVEAFAQTETWAAFTGQAEVNGILEAYRIDVDDLAEPGTGSDTFKITTDSYVSSGVLTGGNIQIHK